MSSSGRHPLASLVVVLLVAASCGGSDDADRTVRVFAAASLTNAFTEMEAAFEGANPGIDVELNLAGSSTLREQILEGAPADVFASAHLSAMEDVLASGDIVDPPVDFALNQLQLAVPSGNPAGVTALRDLTEDDLLVGLCAAAVPCGGLAREALRRAGVEPSLDTEEADVRALLSKIEAGELDAGIVYVSDIVNAGGRVEGIGSPDDLGAFIGYPIAVLADAPNPDAGTDFVGFVLSEAGRTILADAGFGLP